MSKTYYDPHGGVKQIVPDTGITVMPVASVVMYASGATPPTDWLVCDGTAVSRTTYPELFERIGELYGVGDGSTTFNIPDYRELVPVGVGTNTTETITADDTYTLGQFKDDQFQGHWHEDITSGTSGSNPYKADVTADAESRTGGVYTTANPSEDDQGSGTPRTGTTTRTKQIGVHYIIKAKLNSLVVGVDRVKTQVNFGPTGTEATIEFNATTNTIDFIVN